MYQSAVTADLTLENAFKTTPHDLPTFECDAYVVQVAKYIDSSPLAIGYKLTVLGRPELTFYMEVESCVMF